MNETLCRALLRARLSGDDVAARLQVDPKTVRRWMDGRVPYLQHRWALALLVGMDESDLWPQLRAGQSRPGDVVAVYPHRDQVPAETWVRLFGSAWREAGVLGDSELLFAMGTAVLDILAERTVAGVRVRICLSEPDTPAGPGGEAALGAGGSSDSAIREALRSFEFRRHRAHSYNSICYADKQLLVIQHVYGLPGGQSPVLHLRADAEDEMVTSYLGGFERIWAGADVAD